MATQEWHGRITRVIYTPEASATGWCVFMLQPTPTQSNPKPDNVKCVGHFPDAAVNGYVCARGTQKNDARFGEQINARYIAEEPPRGSHDLQIYIRHCAAGDVSEDQACKLTQGRTPEQVIRMLDTGRVNDITDYAGLTPRAAHHVISRWQQARLGAQLRGLCMAAGMSSDEMRTVYAHYHRTQRLAEGIRDLATDPFALSAALPNQFLLLNRLCLTNPNADPVTPARVDSVIRYIMLAGANQGHTFLACEYLANQAQAICNQGVKPDQQCPIAAVNSRIQQLTNAEQLAYLADKAAVSLTTEANQELAIAQDIARLYYATENVTPSLEALYDAMGDFVPTAEQAAAFETIFHNKFALLTGYPGTGKTTITKNLLSGFPANTKVLLLAPTGQAADRLMQATGRDARTIHFALADLARNDRAQFDADLIVVDEASMINAEVGTQLFRACPDSARVIISGDPDQLPAIGSGSILRDMLATRLPQGRLSTPLRQKNASGILVAATEIRQGRVPFRKSKPNDDAVLLRATSDKNCVAQIVGIAQQRLNAGEQPDDIQVLVPARHTKCGTQVLNEQLRELLNTHPDASKPGLMRIMDSDVRPGDRIRHTKNDYKLGLLNGAIGRVQYIDTQEGHVVAQFGHKTYALNGRQAQNLLLDYATTIHRSQGSQFPNTIIGLSASPRHMLDRRLLYTAVTRAENYVAVVAEPESLRTAVQTNPDDGRQTLLRRELDKLLGASEFAKEQKHTTKTAEVVLHG